MALPVHLLIRFRAERRLNADARAGQNWRGAAIMRLKRHCAIPPKWRSAGVFIDGSPALRRSLEPRYVII
jgi:hypothetical protein